MSLIKIIGSKGMHFQFGDIVVSVQMGKNDSCSNREETVTGCDWTTNTKSENAAVAIWKGVKDLTLLVKNKLNLEVNTCGGSDCAELTHVSPENVAKILNYCADSKNF